MPQVLDFSAPVKPREAKLFRNNRSQAVRIPVEFELPGDRVLIHREGHKLIIEPLAGPSDIVALLELWRAEARDQQAAEQLPEIDDAPLGPEDIF